MAASSDNCDILLHEVTDVHDAKQCYFEALESLEALQQIMRSDFGEITADLLVEQERRTLNVERTKEYIYALEVATWNPRALEQWRKKWPSLAK